jgi:hypothetical protein
MIRKAFRPRETSSATLRDLWENGIVSGSPVNGNFDADDVVRRGRERLAATRR